MVAFKAILMLFSMTAANAAGCEKQEQYWNEQFQTYRMRCVGKEEPPKNTDDDALYGELGGDKIGKELSECDGSLQMEWDEQAHDWRLQCLGTKKLPKILRTTEIDLHFEKDSYWVYISVNGSDTFPCKIDSGATVTVFSENLVQGLLNIHALRTEDGGGHSVARLADGRLVDAISFNIRALTITDGSNWIRGTNIEAMTTLAPKTKGKRQHEHATCLIGVSFFGALKSGKLDAETHKLVVEWWELEGAGKGGPGKEAGG